MHKFLILTLAALLAVPTAFAAEATADAPKEKKTRKLGGFFKKYDKDGDGKLNDEEKAAMKADKEKMRAAALEKYDENKDGKLDKAEKAKAKADREAKKGRKDKKAPAAEEKKEDKK